MKWILKILLSTILLCTLINFASALPAGPRTITGEIDYRLDTFAAKSNDAFAGNITELNFNAWTITRTWQGYYGNVTGTIVLADQYNKTLYDWSNTNPNGRLYAARTSGVDWTSIACASKDELNDDEADFTATNLTDRLGNWPIDAPNMTFVNSTDFVRGDGVTNRNIIYANYTTFWVGPVQINGTVGTEIPNSGGQTVSTGECFSVALDNSTAWENNNPMASNDMAHWREVALADGNGDGNIVYTAILEQNYAGFDGRSHDFELIVGEDGHGTNIAISTYFFYVELE